MTDSGTEQAKGASVPVWPRLERPRACGAGKPGRADAPPAFPFRVFPVCCLLFACFLSFSLL
ncbi:hypothetical protein LNP74_34595 [Klebsiella pneumoniae subsp. pneumoniae]|nr:hypothetical protein [Klebsiella pneumoniae subsp. pneumoniae]